MSKRDRDARRQLDDLFGTDQLGQRSSPRQDRDTWAAGRAEKARKAEETKKARDTAKKLKADAAKRRHQNNKTKPKRKGFL